MNVDTPLISIIVPIYNAEFYLNDCLSSIASQTYEHIEVILINDGSTDSSGDIANQFCNNDDRFQLINQSNSGVAAAREKALRLARGEFVIHTDSDDLMTERAIEYLYKSIIENDSNVAVGAYIKQNNLGQEVVHHSQNNKHIFTSKILDGEYRSVLWNKLIKMDLCRNISFEKNINYMEDVLFLSKVLNNDNIKISIVDEVVYFYRKVDTSYTNNITYESIISSIKVIDKICEMYKDTYSDEFIAHVKNRNKVRVLLNSNETQRNTFPESNKHLFSDKKMALKHKIVVISDLLYLNSSIKFYKSLKNKIFS